MKDYLGALVEAVRDGYERQDKPNTFWVEIMYNDVLEERVIDALLDLVKNYKTENL